MNPLLRKVKPILAATLAGSLCTSCAMMADELPEQEFELTRNAIEDAQEVDSGAVAGNELLLAEQKLERARHMNEDGEEEQAARLLTEARLHAEYAEIRGMHATATASLDEINDALADLNRELGRQQ